jgi:tetratricopeptide (TPR) repeat protein
MARIYLSSTFEDLKDHRAAVYRALRQMRHDVVSMEDYAAGEARPVDACLADVAACDVYIGVFAWRYGYVPADDNPDALSITELEYRHAGRTGKPRLVFLLDSMVPWPRGYSDDVTGDGDRGARIKAFRDRLERERLRATFTSPDDLASEVSVALVKQLQAFTEAGLREERRRLAEESSQRSERTGLRVVGAHVLDVGELFKGRLTEQRELGKLLADRGTRVVSVIGRPGIGKTALASKVLGDLEHGRWPHTDEAIPVNGIVYMSTRTQGVSLERLFLDCAALLGGEREAALVKVWSSGHLDTAQKSERLLRELDSGLYVILLDHMEESLDETGTLIDPDLRTFFERSLASPHGPRVLLTSRTPLAFEARLLRFDRRVSLTEGLTTPEGIAFLRDMDPSGVFGIQAIPDEQLARAVERVNGIPRALEVLGGIIKDEPFRTLDEILDRFYEEDTADELIREGYRRLDQDERRAIDALAVLGRPVPPVAVQFMLEPVAPGLNAEGVLRRLIHVHMVTFDRASRTVALNAIDQDFAYRELPDEGEYSKSLLERRVADYYARLRVPRANWRSALDFEPDLLELTHLLRARDHDAAADALQRIDAEFVATRGYARRLEALLSRVDEASDARLRMGADFALGQCHMFLGPLEKALEHLHRARAAAADLDDAEIALRATGFLGETLRRLGRLDEAITHLEVAGDLSSPVGRRSNFPLGLGLSYIYHQRFDAGLHVGERMMEIAVTDRDDELRAQALDVLALAALGARHYEAALDRARQAAEIYRKRDAMDPYGYMLNVQGLAQMGLGRIADAQRSFESGLSVSRKDDNPRLEGFCSFNLARLHFAQGDTPRALNAARAAERIFGAIEAVEEAAAREFVRVIEADGDAGPIARMRALMACARHTAATPDLLAPDDLLDEAERLAREHGCADLLAEVVSARGAPHGAAG